MEKLALVTGASGGIGSAIASTLQQKGYTVVGLERTPKGDFNFDQIQCDLSDLASIEAATNSVFQKHGVPSLLVNNAGAYFAKTWDVENLEEFKTTMDVNVTAAFVLTKLVGQKMIEAGIEGNIINITSVSAFIGSLDPAYAASKAGLTALSKSFAKALAPHKIRVNSIAPGPVDTKMGDSIPEDRKQSYKAAIPLKRFAQPNEIASVVGYLVDDGASYITGTTVNVNGGLY